MSEPPWDDPPTPTPKKALPPAPARRAVSRADLVELVESRFPKGRWVRPDQWEGLCPCHEDTRPSFGVGLRDHTDKNGVPGYTLLMKCLSCGAGLKDVCSALGIDESDCFTYDPTARKARGPAGAPRREVAVYPYVDEQGTVLYEVVRYEPKDFRQRRVLPNGVREWKLGDVRRVLFNLPAVREAAETGKRVYFVEGEKDAQSLGRARAVATTNMGGAAMRPGEKKWRAEYEDQLAGVAQLVVIPDNDEPGRAHAQIVADSVKAKVGEVVVVDLARFWPDMPVKADVSDLLVKHGDVEGLALLARWVEEARTPKETALVPAEKVDALPDAPVAKGKKAMVGPTDWRGLTTPWEQLLEVEATRGVPRVVPCPYNVALVLEGHPFFRGRIRYDEFMNRIRFNPPEWWQPPVVDRLWRANDTTFFRQWCDKNLRAVVTNKDGDEIVGPGAHFGKEVVQEAILSVGEWNHCHPLRDWLNALVWDGKPRLHAWLVKYCNAAFGRYTQLVGTAWMVSAVARVMEPGCQADHMLVLRGGQGIRKSGLFRLLAGALYGSMQGVDLKLKEAKQHLLGRWILEFAELEHMDRNEISTIKAYLTEISDDFRKPYAAEEEAFPRQCVFGGTINDQAFLKDDTGNRRFWVVECGDSTIDMEGLAQVREQLFAEAVARYRLFKDAEARGDKAAKIEYQWWLEKPDEDLAREVQRANLVAGPYDEMVADWLEDDGRQPGSLLAEAVTIDGQPHITVTQVIRCVLKRDPKPGDDKFIGGALKRAGWYDARRRPPGSTRRSNPRRYWHPEPYEAVQGELVEEPQAAPEAPEKGGDDELPF